MLRREQRRDFESKLAEQQQAKIIAAATAMHRSRSHDAVIRVYDEAGNVIEAHEHAGILRVVKSFNYCFFECTRCQLWSSPESVSTNCKMRKL